MEQRPEEETHRVLMEAIVTMVLLTHGVDTGNVGRFIQTFTVVLTQLGRSIGVDKNEGCRFSWIAYILLLVNYTLAQGMEVPKEVIGRHHLKEGTEADIKQSRTILIFQDEN